MITPDVGGGFGAKGFSYPEELLCPWLARRARPAGAVVRDAQREHARARPWPGPGAGRRRSAAPETAWCSPTGLTVVQDTGAYPRMAAILPFITRHDADRDVRHPGCRVRGPQRRDQHRPDGRLPRGGPARGGRRDRAGHRPVRRRDRHGPCRGPPAQRRCRPIAFPFTTPTGTTYDCGQLRAALELVLEAAGYEALRAEQRRRRDAGDVRAARHRPVGLRGGHRAAAAAPSTATCRCCPTGTVRALTGHLAARAGSRHGVGDARQRRARRAASTPSR